MQASAPAPLKTLMNLTTTIDSLVFSPDTQVRFRTLSLRFLVQELGVL